MPFHSRRPMFARSFCAPLRFLILMAMTAGISGAAQAQITSYDVFLQTNYEQIAPDSVTGPNSYEAFFDLHTSNPDEALGVTVTTPSGSVFPLSGGSGGVDFTASTGAYATQDAFQTALPPGEYDYTINGGAFDGVLNSLIVPETPGYPFAVPTLTQDSYNALQSFNGTTPVTLNWNAFTVPDGYNPLAYLYFIPQTPGATPLYESLGADATAYTLNPASLSSSADYRGYLHFTANQSSPGQSNGAGALPTAFTIYQNVTSFVFNTSGIAAAEPSGFGLAIAPFVFAGAAWLRRRSRRKK